MHYFNKFFHLQKNKPTMTLGAVIGVALGIMAIANITMPSNAVAAGLPTGDPSNIISGGLPTIDTLITDYNAKTPSDIQDIYGAYGLQSSDIATLKQKTVTGTLKNDGTLTVNGKVVADTAETIGRKGSADGYMNTTPKTIAGKTYYTIPVSYVLNYYKIPSTEAYVLMTDNNKVKFVVMNDCGNPVSVTQPEYSCDMLNAKKVDDTHYQFTANVTAKNGATLSKLVYDFGDGSAQVTETSATTVVSHAYTQYGNFTAKVTAYFTYHGQTETVTATNCQKQINIPQPQQPVYECTALNQTQITDTKYTFTAVAKTANGATLQDAGFDFGDGQTATNQVAITHDYAKEGDYTITATLNFSVGSEVKNATCSTKITVKKQTTPVYECSNLTPIVISTKEYEFDATANTAGGATLTNANFDFGDGQSASNIAPTSTNQNKVTTKHTYANAGTYKITATLNFNVAGSVKNATCSTQITINQETTTTQLPSTGPVDTIGSAIGVSSIVGVGTHYLRTRRDLAAKFKR